jgi:hypothetical protein
VLDLVGDGVGELVGVDVLVGVEDGVLVGETVGFGVLGVGVGLLCLDGVAVGVGVLAGFADVLGVLYRLAMNNRIASARSR